MQNVITRLGEPRRRELQDDLATRLGHPIDRAVRGVLRPVPGFVLGVFALVVLLAGVLAPIVAPSGGWFVVLAALGGAAVGIALFIALPRVIGRQGAVVVAVAGDEVMVYEVTAAQRSGDWIAAASRDRVITRSLPMWRRWVDGLFGGVIVVDGTEVGLHQRLDL